MNALKEKRARRVTLGDIALREGLITRERMEDALELQKRSKLRFGQIAVQLGYLRRDDIIYLLKIQMDEPPSFAEILVEMGSISQTILETALDDFHDAYDTKLTHSSD